ncbi:glucosaminidase domain-containing protein [Terrimonas sp. NA20]|uniref:Glucosaminidase domain-containing protein n=1 Tax=Terrimonas ginsenosidimutans TaxID=2908004 RepID=A0ABS9KVM8_9BACT|nr:glucosaminidase domain-containing protein [Terrimonas ginsenosidimutans]MCG2616407.1 glucosaminidase domain-containing protein [Terrimonas ginsenosidimutans]
MKKIRAFWVIAMLTASVVLHAQEAGIIEEYIEKYKELAIAEMQRTGVPASIKLAQGIHETMAGTSVLVQKSNNHFGIKCKSNWAGESVSHDDDARGECFRKYPAAEDSYKDHSNFLKNNQRYAGLFKLDPLDYEGWANGLKKAGYATNPKYPVIIIRLIETYKLQDYSLIALGKMERSDIAAGGNTPTDSSTTAGENASQTTPAGDDDPGQMELAPVSYPAGEFRINDTRVIYGAKGTPMLVIAQQYNVPLGRLFEFNEMAQVETLPSDQLVYIQRKRSKGHNEFHIVRAGETLRDISQTEAIRLEFLLEYNQLKEHMRPAAGEKLYLRGPAPSVPKLAKRESN